MKGDCLQGQTSSSDIYDIIQYEVRRAVQDIHNDLLNVSFGTVPIFLLFLLFVLLVSRLYEEVFGYIVEEYE